MNNLKKVKQRLEFKMGNFLELLNSPFHPNRHLVFLDAYNYHIFAEDLNIQTDLERETFNQISFAYFGYTWSEMHTLMKKQANITVGKLLRKPTVEQLSEQENMALLKFDELFPNINL